jgi:CheY-like chemotaxis protein
VVRDTGGGIPADQLPHVFERFRRVEGAAARTHEGTGIGLALVQELGRLHGGSVSVTSEVGRGTTFRVAIPAGHAHLPGEQIVAPSAGSAVASSAQAYVGEALRWLPDALATPPPDGASWPVPPSAPLLSEAPAYRRRPRIVLADDNADMRSYVQRLLSERFAVEAVVDGEAALAAIAEARPDLVVSDVQMPRLDGLELARRIRADPALRGLPIVLVSTLDAAEDRAAGLEAGADAYLSKRELVGSALVDLARRVLGEGAA